MSGFTESEINTILTCKLRIQEKIVKCREALWWTSLVDENKIFLSGGAIASLLQFQTPRDWDFYFLDKGVSERFDKRVRADYMSAVQDVKENYAESVGVDGKLITANAITMYNQTSFITLLSGTPEEIRSTFDYVHCMPYYYNGTLFITKRQYDACVKRYLIVNNEVNVKPYREQKFLSRGYVLSA